MFMKMFRLAGVIAILLSVSSVLQAQTEITNAEKRIKTVDYFAIGGVGVAGRTSQGETDLRLLLAQPKQTSIDTFERIYKEGNTPAKIYALFALKMIGSVKYNDLFKELRSSSSKVITMQGCISSARKVKEVVNEIDSGDTEKFYFIKYQSKK